MVSLQGCVHKVASRQSKMAVPLGSALGAMLEALLQGSIVYSLVREIAIALAVEDRIAAE